MNPGVDTRRHTDTQPLRDVDARVRLRTRQQNHQHLTGRGPLAELEQAAVDETVDWRTNLVPCEVLGQLVAPRGSLFDSALGLLQLLDGRAAQEFLQSRTVDREAGLGSIQSGFRRVEKLRGGQFTRMEFFNARMVRAAKSQLVLSAGDIGPGGSDQLAARSANQFVEPRLGLRECRRCLGKAGAGAGRVLPHESLAGDHGVAFGDEDLHDRLRRFCGQFDAVRRQLADDDIIGGGATAGREQQRE